jgi:hypothetical protein
VRVLLSLIHFLCCSQIPLPPALSVPTFVPGPSAASSGAAGGGSAAPKYRTIAVEFDDQHNQERVSAVAAFVVYNFSD